MKSRLLMHLKALAVMLSFFLLVLFFWICVNGSGLVFGSFFSRETSPVENSIYIEVGESPQVLSGRYGSLLDENKKNSAKYGVTFYSINWSDNESGSLSVRNGKSQLALSSVLNVMGTYDEMYPSEGVYDYMVQLGLPPRNNLLHQDAMVQLYALLRKIRLAGWVRWVEPDAPRLKGEDSFRYQMSGLDSAADLYSLDPIQMPTLDEWMKLENFTRWQFYQSGVHMDVSFDRDRSRMDPHKPGAYHLTISLISENEYQRGSFQGDDRQRWKELYPAARKVYATEREQIETQLRGMGYNIDKHYQNPDE